MEDTEGTDRCADAVDMVAGTTGTEGGEFAWFPSRRSLFRWNAC